MSFQHRDIGVVAEQGEIQCVAIVDSTAYLSGTYTHSSDAVVVGSPFLFVVVFRPG
ncbi:MAG: hypothetical protein LUO93_01670 [Methanomicrobiales archaeon]|nr:hypothetical protein [Methanomicrobiales archaeon]